MLKKIKESCEYVSKNSKHVTIDEEKLNYLVNQIKDIKMEHWLSSSPFGLLELSSEDIINFLLIYESINFSYWGNPKWEVNTDNGPLDGSIALLYILLKYVKENGIINLSNISKQEFSNILKGNVEIPLLEERFNILKNVTKIVNEKMNGNFYKFIEHITNAEDLFKIIVTNFSSFKDERTYNRKTIYFYKLAQLLTSDILHIRQMKEHINVDYSALIGCADYKIPQTLRAMGILIYDDELATLVDNKKELAKNSAYEIEIRASQIAVIIKISELLDNKYDCIDINDYLYLQKNNKNLVFKPYHLTRCTNY